MAAFQLAAFRLNDEILAESYSDCSCSTVLSVGQDVKSNAAAD